MKSPRGKWTWSQLHRHDSDTISILLSKKNDSIAITLPRPAGWVGTTTEDREFIRNLLFEAAEEPWSTS